MTVQVPAWMRRPVTVVEDDGDSGGTFDYADNLSHLPESWPGDNPVDISATGVNTFYGIDELPEGGSAVTSDPPIDDPEKEVRTDVQKAVRESDSSAPVTVRIADFPGTGTGATNRTLVPNRPIRLVRENPKRRTVILLNPLTVIAGGAANVGILYYGFTAGEASLDVGMPIVVGEKVYLDVTAAIWITSDQAAGSPVCIQSLVSGEGEG